MRRNRYVNVLKAIVLSGIFVQMSMTLSGQCNAVIGSNINPIEGCEVLTVQFFDLSSGVVSRTWDFGDGSDPSIAQNPVHSFQAGKGDTTYTVTLSITCASGTSQATVDVTVFAKPTITFSSDKSSVCAITDSVCFEVEEPFNSSYAYTWNFGDGTISNEYEPCKSYSTAGQYDVELTVINENGCLNTAVQEEFLTVEPVPSTAFSVSATVGCSPLTVEFTNLTDTIGEVFTNWTWDYGDGTEKTYDFNSPVHTFTEPGEYTVTLGTTNVLGCYNYSTQNITVNPTPKAGMDFVETVCENDTAVIMFSGEYDASPSFSWDFGDASYVQGSGEGPYLVKWDSPGIKDIGLQLEENGCVASVSEEIQVSPLAEVYLSISANEDSICTGEEVEFTASPPFFSSYRYFVNSTAVQSSSSNKYATTTLNNNDRIYVEISDVNGCSRIISDTLTISVLNRPSVSISSSATNDSICIGQNVTFSADPPGLSEYVFSLNNEIVQQGPLHEYSSDLLEDQDRIEVYALENTCESSTAPSIVTTVSEPLPAPQVNCGLTTLSEITFLWDEVPGAAGYLVSVDNGAWESPSSGTSGTSHTLTGLGTGESHEIRVKAFDGSVCGEGIISEPVTCVSQECDEISFYAGNTSVEVCENEYTTLEIDSINLSDYRIEWAGNPGLNKAELSFIAIGDSIIPVRVFNTQQPSCPPATKTFQVDVQPKVNLQLNLTEGSAVACEGEVLEFTATPATQAGYSFFSNNNLVQEGTSNELRTSLTPGVHQVFAASNRFGCTSWSDTLNLVVRHATPVPVVNFLTSDESSVLFGWNDIPGATGYMVSINFGTFIMPSGGPMATTHLVEGLNPGEAVTCSVIALSDGPCGASAQSQPAYAYAAECQSFDYSIDEQFSICEGDSVMLEIQDLEIQNFRVSWGDQPESTARRKWFSPASDTIIPVAVRDLDHPLCPRIIKYVEILVDSKPQTVTLQSSDDDNIICEGEEVTFTALPGGYDDYEFFYGFNKLDGNYFNAFTTSTLKDGDEIRARAVSGGCKGDFSNSIITTVKESPSAPQVNCGVTTSSTISFTWDAVTDAIGYQVSVNDQHFITPTSGITGLTHDLTGLTAGDSATISVVALSDAPCGNSMLSNLQTCYATDCDLITFDLEPEVTACQDETVDLSINSINIPDYEIRWDGGTATSDTVYAYQCLDDAEVTVELTDLDQTGCQPVKRKFDISVIKMEDITLQSNSTRDSICAYDDLVFTAGPASYDRFVFFNNGVEIQDSALNTLVLSGAGNDNLVSVEVYHRGCKKVSAEIHTEIVQSAPLTLSASRSGTLCTDELVTFTATDGFRSYIFTDGFNTLLTGTSPSVEIPVRSNVITVNALNALNCISTSDDTIHFDPLPLPEVEILPGTDSICLGTLTGFTASPANLATYYFIRNGEDLMQNSDLYVYATDSLRRNDVISVIATDANGCNSRPAIAGGPGIIPYPETTIEQQDPGICLFGETALWIERDSVMVSGINYRWDSGETSDTIVVAPEYDRWYALYYSDARCSNVKLDEALVEVDRDPPPVAYAGPDTTICLGETIMLEGSGGSYFLWSPDSTLDDASLQAPYATPEETTRYVLTVINEYCYDTDTVEVVVDLCLTDLVNPVPQIITPNGDGANDTWIIDFVDYFTYNRLVIFNRWGNVVYEASPYGNDWDGTSMNGKPLPEGTYFYILDLGNETDPHKGYIIIHR